MPVLLARRLAGLIALLLVVATSAGLARGEPTAPPAPPFRATLPPGQPPEIAGAPAPIALPAAQGTLRSFGAVADAEVREESPGTNFGIMGSLSAGFEDGPEGATGRVHRALLRFDIGSSLPPGTVIHEARLVLTTQRYCDYDFVSRVTVYRVSEPWSEGGVTWADQPGFAESYGLADIPVALGAPFSFDVTALARRWVAGQEPEHGLMLRGPEDTPNPCAIRGFFSRGDGLAQRRPVLLVDYTLPAPALLSPQGDQAFERASCRDTPAPRALAIASNHAQLATYSVRVSVGANWLSATAGLGKVSRIFPDQLTLEVAPGAPCGDLTATVTIEAPGLAATSFDVVLRDGALERRAFLPMVVTGGAPQSALLAAGPSPAASDPARVAIFVGISDYKHLGPPGAGLFRAGEWGFDLGEAGVDPEAIRSELALRAAYQRSYTLRGPDASLEHIRHAFDYVARYYDAEDAEFLLFFSGHGAQTGDTCPLGGRGGLQCSPDEADSKDELLAPYDANQTREEGFTNVLLDDELKARIGAFKSRRFAVIADACHSGGLESGGPGHAVLAASAESQLSWETSAREHGVFTSFLLEALRRPANDLNRDGCISLGELYEAVRGPVKAYVKQNIPDPRNDQDVAAQIGADMCIAPLAAGQ